MQKQERNQLVAMKRLQVRRKTSSKLSFAAPREPGLYAYTLYLTSDGYLGLDQATAFSVRVNLKSAV